MRVVDGGRHHHDDNGCLGQCRSFAGKLKLRSGGKRLRGHLSAGVMPRPVVVQFARIQVEADRPPAATKRHGQRQAHIAQADNCYGFLHG